jgi:hypothetical protein
LIDKALEAARRSCRDAGRHEFAFAPDLETVIGLSAMELNWWKRTHGWRSGRRWML